MSPFGCPDTVYGEHNPNRQGVCTWCTRKVAPAMPRPDRFDGPTRLDEAYDYHYSPDGVR